MTQEYTLDTTPSVTLNASEDVKQKLPTWLGDVAIMAEIWKTSGLLEKLQRNVHVLRGRMGVYEVCDFVLAELAYVCGHEPSWRSFYRTLGKDNSCLAELWGREKISTRTALSRFHKAIRESSVEALRSLLFEDLLEHGVNSESLGGVLDRNGKRHILFDMDGTRQTAREREVVTNNNYPPPQRRFTQMCAPGYKGRKRGEIVRTRTAIQQSHTQEWLGTFGAPGNGHPLLELEKGCEAISKYMQAQQMPNSAGLLRLDGLYGYAKYLAVPNQFGIGYISRCVDYALLSILGIPELMAECEPCEFESIDTGKVRHVYDVGWFEWASVGQSDKAFKTRLIVGRCPAPSEGRKHKVGKKVGSFVYELFSTDRDSSSLTASDVISLYFGRGGFEDTFKHEDKEQEPDRWYSSNPIAQEWCQLLSQWVWNKRLHLGLIENDSSVRCTVWSDALPFDEKPTQLEAEGFPACGPGSGSLNSRPSYTRPSFLQQASQEQEENSQTERLQPQTQVEQDESKQSHFEPADFILEDEKTLRCPAGKLLRRREKRQLCHGQERVRFAAKASDCWNCSQKNRCRPNSRDSKTGRRIALPIVNGKPQIPARRGIPSPVGPSRPIEPRVKPLHTSPEQAGPRPLLFYDLPASILRRFLPVLLLSVQVTVVKTLLPELSSTPKPKWFTRGQRAHRRLNYAERLARNALPKAAVPGSIFIHGLPKSISEYLVILTQKSRGP